MTNENFLKTLFMISMTTVFSWSAAVSSQGTNTSTNAAGGPEKRVQGFNTMNIYKPFYVDGKMIYFEKDDGVYGQLIRNDKEALRHFHRYQGDKFWGGVMVGTGAVVGIAGLIGLAYAGGFPNQPLFWPIFGGSIGAGILGTIVIFGGIGVQSHSVKAFQDSVESLDRPGKIALQFGPKEGWLVYQMSF